MRSLALALHRQARSALGLGALMLCIAVESTWALLSARAERRG